MAVCKPHTPFYAITSIVMLSSTHTLLGFRILIRAEAVVYANYDYSHAIGGHHTPLYFLA